MRDADYYAPGSYYDPNAPWNQTEPDPVELDVEVSVTLSRVATVETTNYNYDEDGVDIQDTDGDISGYYSEAYTDIPTLLNELAKYIRAELSNGCEPHRKWDLQKMLASCEGWEITDFEIEDVNIN